MIKALLADRFKFDDSIMILFVVIIIILSITCLLLLIRSIRKEKSRWSEYQGNNGIITASQLDEFLTKKLQAGKRTVFSLFQIDISDFESLIRSFGKIQYQTAINQFVNNVRLLMNNEVKISQLNDESIMLYMKSKLNLQNISQLCQMILLESQKSLIVAGALKIEFDINIGVVSYPESGRTLEILKQNLNLTIVSAKRKGISQFAVYDINITNKESQEYKSYIEIKSAIENKEFTLYYQPIVDINSMEVFGAESLLRWNHREKGVLPPSKFLDIMEHTGDINWVGYWAMEQLIKQAILWKNQYPDQKLMLSMNLSPKQLMNPQLTDELRRILRKYKVNTGEFCMEIVEFAVFDSVETVKENITKLRQMGFLIAIDNYGLEFSTFKRLSELTIDIIKLNRSFIKQSQENDMSLQILKMLIRFAKEKNISIVAEGIENQEIVEYVKSQGVNFGQGYFFAKPQTPKELMNSVILTPWANIEKAE